MSIVELLLALLATFWINYNRGYLLLSGLSRWMEVPSSKQSLRRNARGVVLSFSFYHPAHPSSMGVWSGPIGPILRNSMR